uniref:Nuclear RNA export factor 1 n=1 Tax=Lygus hesperus TaxID=30085 RepID=A0A0A9XMC0_LYGHE
MSKENPFVFTRANCEVVSEFARSNSLLKQTMNSESHWNRITILNGTKYEKQMILELVVSSVYPHTLYPCMYREDDNDTFFLFKNGFAAVMSLCARKLYLVDPETNQNIELSITAQYVSASLFPLDPMNTLEEVIKKRIKRDKQLLDLRNLRGEPEMADLYCSLNCLTFWDILMQLKKKHMPTIHGWILSHNGITKVDVLDPISKYDVPLLDLRYNRITKDGYRKMNKSFQIGHLLLEGNPMVADFENTWEMVRFVKTRVRVSTLDFLNVDDDNRSLRCFPFPSYIIEPSFKSFVDHFMFHFFKKFEKDKVERKKLSLMYHEEASYSVSLFKSGPDPLTSSASDYLAMAVDSVDHNFICPGPARMIKKYDNILFGKSKIGLGLTKIPDILFAFSTFSIDVPIACDTVVQIVINGVCRFAGNPKKYCFSRNTLLVPSEKNRGEWVITNDLWNFSHAITKPTKTINDIFKANRRETVKGDFAVMLNPQLKDKETLRKLIRKLTKMKPDWVERFLDESDWDLEFTLQSFTDQFKADVIPIDAFDIPKERLESLSPLVQALKEKQTLLGI